MPASKPTILLIAIRQGFFSREVLRGILSARRTLEDWDLWVVPPIDDQRHLDDCLRSRHVVGVITRGLSPHLVKYLEERNIPVVSIRGPEDGGKRALDGLHVDDETIGQIAGGEFVRLGLRQWGFVHWQGVSWSEARKQSLQAFARSQGVEVGVISLAPEKRHDWSGVLEISEWLESQAKPCGILACNDEAGVAVLHACKLSGLSAPDQVAVIGVDNDRLLCETSSPSLSSIDLHAAEIGRVAAGKLLATVWGESESSEKHLTPAVMVVRESSHHVDRYLLVFQTARDYIARHALTGPSVETVAHACGVSKRGLERAFAKHCAESPAAVIREQRAAGILRLLKNQSLGLSHIAQQSGFSDAAGLSNFVKRVTGKSPGAWRDSD